MNTFAQPFISVRVHDRRVEAEGVISLDLRALDGELPAFEAGAHIDIEVPASDARPALTRQYSLCNAPAERHRYVVGIGRDPASKGGSVALHDEVRTGDVLRISAPRNHFPLAESAPESILIAGGIGITPMLAMTRRLSELGRAWTLYYCVRTPARAAFLDEAKSLPGRVTPIFDGMPGVKQLDIEAVVAQADPGAHLYCCGPAPLLQAFERATAHRRADAVHVEWFQGRATLAPTGGDHAFELKLARSGKSLTVQAGQSILDVLLDAGVQISHSCCDGVCGSCETRVLAGQPDHRDAVLLGEDAQASDRMMVCVSRCHGTSLTLDL